MHGVGIDESLKFWFDEKVPETSHDSKLIESKIIEFCIPPKVFSDDRALWLGALPDVLGLENEEAFLHLNSREGSESISMPSALAEWFYHLLPQLIPEQDPISYNEIEEFYKQYFGEGFKEFTKSQIWHKLRKHGLTFLRKN